MLSESDINAIVKQISDMIVSEKIIGRWLTIDEAMAYAKVKSRTTIWRWIQDGRIHAHKRTGSWIVDRESEEHKIWSWRPERIEMELIKCVPMCKKCHNMFHAILKKKPPEHGTTHMYGKYGCRCDQCKKAKADERTHYRLKERAIPIDRDTKTQRKACL